MILFISPLHPLFKGYIKSPYDYIAGADYLILPSRWEGLPNVVLESLVLGTPVITFKDIKALNDYKDSIKKANIIMCEDEKEMLEKIKKLKVRKDIKKIKMRECLLNNQNSPSFYQKKINDLMLNM